MIEGIGPRETTIEPDLCLRTVGGDSLPKRPQIIGVYASGWHDGHKFWYVV